MYEYTYVLKQQLSSTLGGEVPDKIGYLVFCEMALLDKCCCLFAPRMGNGNEFWHHATNEMALYTQ